ncbi:MAG: serine/threonine protein kinase [Deltaproteobacteria bacterium]|nr:serine/threonine protein kinase [Deltaproteobacteria bacterium]
MNKVQRRYSSISTDLIGKQVLGRYHIVRKIASGGMGVVYLARYSGAHDFAKPVVVKIILPGYAGDKQFLGLFIREAKILASLHHPGIVEVIDFGEQEDFYVMVLEYVHGFQLREWAMYREHIGKVFSIDVILQLVIDVLEALHHAHSLKTPDGSTSKVIHRDISPSNVMLTIDGRIKLVDFGIARMSNMTGGYSTETGSFRGKLSYAAPERFGQNELTAETDIYSVGVMLHELLTGHNEFFTGDHARTIARVLSHQVSSVLIKRPDAPPRLDKVIAKALSKDWELRYSSAMDFADDLRGMLVQSESRVKEKIGAQATEDFNDEMAAYLGTQSLSDLERAWRFPSTLPIPDYTISAAQEETVNLKQEIAGNVSGPYQITDVYRSRYRSTLPPEHQQSSLALSVEPRMDYEPVPTGASASNRTELVLRARPSIVIAIMLTIVAAIAGTILWFASQPPPTPDKFFVVQGNAPSTADNLSHPGRPTPNVLVPTESLPENTLPAQTTQKVHPDTPASPRASSSENVKNHNRKSASTTPMSEDEQLMMLSRVFSQKQRAIETCLSSNENSLSNIDRIYVHFSINDTGNVLKTAVAPAQLQGTALADCIAKIARRTRFPGLGKPLSFAIPIAVTRSGN